MREILFRGKSVPRGEWVYGFYAACKPRLSDSNRCVIQPVDERGVPEVLVNVDPYTVGQYTGLCDKNGKKIFEGDIVEGAVHSAWSHRIQRCVVAYGRDGFECRHHADGLYSEYFTYRVMFSRSVEVIGNIHDSPELLKGE